MKLWWEREDLKYNGNNILEFTGRQLPDMAKQTDTPVFFYSAERIKDNLNRIHRALEKTGLKHRVLYALKANRFAPLVTYLKMTGLCGVDVCSPEEITHALSCGFKESEISYTGTSVSAKDLKQILSYPDLMLNCDSLSMMRRIGELTPGREGLEREIGIRINPAMGTGYGSNELLRYSGDKPTKFGIYLSEFEQAINIARKNNLKITRVHFHTGCGYLNDQLDVWEQILNQCLTFIKKLPDVRQVNLGGGLGVPHTKDDLPLDMDAWAGAIKRAFSGSDYEIQVEPGTYIVKDAGVLVLEVNTVEQKAGHRFIGVNGGFHLAMEPAHYKLPYEPAPCLFAGNKNKYFSQDNLSPAHVAGNINEALDMWIQAFPMPEISEDSLLAITNAGAYASAMSSNHCMRGRFSEYLLFQQ